MNLGATEADAQYSGPSGVKMNGPYEYVPPVYWYEDDKFGGAWNFNTETSPGPAVPPIESLRAAARGQALAPNRHWNYHAGRGAFANIDVFKKAQDQRYGPSRGGGVCAEGPGDDLRAPARHDGGLR